MVAPKPVFQNIAEEIIQFIQKADSEILVNVPWFTDESLFEQLRLKAELGVAVSIGIEDDGINEKAPFDHRIIVRFGGRLYLHTKRGGKGINHEKYCVIDQRYVIFGSYNWTYSAARHNRESVVIFDDPALAKQYIQQFQGMTRLKRVTCIEQTPSAAPPVEKGLIDPSLSLKMEIRLLETEVAQLETEKADLENKLEYATIYIHLALRDLFREKLRVQAILAVFKASQTAKAVDRQQAEEQQRLVEEAENRVISLLRANAFPRLSWPILINCWNAPRPPLRSPVPTPPAFPAPVPRLSFSCSTSRAACPKPWTRGKEKCNKRSFWRMPSTTCSTN